MSHIVEIKTEVRDVAAAQAACRRLKLEPPVEGKTRLFSGEAVHLPEWRYPVVFETGTSQAHFDNFNERWGKRRKGDAADAAHCFGFRGRPRERSVSSS